MLENIRRTLLTYKFLLMTLALATVAALLMAMLGFRTLAACPSFFVEDDAWFYMQIGYNLGTTGQSTFDGIHATSGYHLAWGGLLSLTAAATSIFSPDKSLFLLAAMAGGIHRNKSYPAEMIYVNLAVQTNVIDSAYCHGVKKLLFPGSACSYPRQCPMPRAHS